MRVEHDRPPRAGRGELAVDGGRTARRLQQSRREAAALQHGTEVIGVPPDERRVARQVGNGEQPGELADDLVVVCLTIRAHPLAHGARIGGLRVESRRGHDERQREEGES